MDDALPDPNVTPYRPDLAAVELRGVVPATRYVSGTPLLATRGALPVTGAPDAAASRTSELLFGEVFVAYERRAGWAWGQIRTDGYVGYVPDDGLVDGVQEPTHKVAVLRAFLFPRPDLKARPLDTLGLGARVSVIDRVVGYARLATGGWLSESVLAPLDAVEPDFLATAERLLGVPYLWGGRSPAGLDCSGLVQLVLAEAGVPAPRDSYMQATALGRPMAAGTALRRGDLVFFPKHVGLMADAAALLHANATRMAVSLDPLADVAARVEAAEGRGVTAVRRLVHRTLSRAAEPGP